MARALYGSVEGGGSKFLCALGSGPDDLVEVARIETTTPEQTLEEVISFFAPHRARLTSVGVCCFGPLELTQGAANYGALPRTPKPGWSDAQVVGPLQSALQVPIAIDTDVNGAALAEQRWGAARDRDPVAYVTVGTGVGVGVVIQGATLHGLVHPELGHLRCEAQGLRGHCPFHGACVEGLVSAPALRARTGMEPDALSDDHPVWDSAARTLGELLDAIVLAYSPRAIVLGGGVFQRAPLLDKVRQALLASLNGYLPRTELTPDHVQRYVVPAQLGSLAGALGGFVLAERASSMRAR